MTLGGWRAGTLAVLLLSAGVANAREIEKVDFPEKIEWAGQTLQLNGAALRTKRRFGIDFRVYVAGLYAATKAKSAEAFLDSTAPRVLRVQFLRSLSKGTLSESLAEGFNKNCAATCKAAMPNLEKLNAQMLDVHDGAEWIFRFNGDKVSVEINAKTKVAFDLEGKDFARDLLATFIGDEPPTPEFKKGLLAGE